jgi:hypothetical protein
MASIHDQLSAITELADRAEGFLSDAEFRDEMEMKYLRYYQASAHFQQAQYIQNGIIIELLARQAGEDLADDD